MFDALFDRLSIMSCNNNFWKRSHYTLFEGSWNVILIFGNFPLLRLIKDWALMNGISWNGFH
jgi:hypothetical protein